MFFAASFQLCPYFQFFSHRRSPNASPQEDQPLDQQLQAIAAAHHGKLAVYARNLRTGQTASLSPDLPVKTASTIKLGILLDAAEQIRAGHASLAEKLVLEHETRSKAPACWANSPRPWRLPSAIRSRSW